MCFFVLMLESVVGFWFCICQLYGIQEMLLIVGLSVEVGIFVKFLFLDVLCCSGFVQDVVDDIEGEVFVEIQEEVGDFEWKWGYVCL